MNRISWRSGVTRGVSDRTAHKQVPVTERLRLPSGPTRPELDSSACRARQDSARTPPSPSARYPRSWPGCGLSRSERRKRSPRPRRSSTVCPRWWSPAARLTTCCSARARPECRRSYIQRAGQCGPLAFYPRSGDYGLVGPVSRCRRPSPPNSRISPPVRHTAARQQRRCSVCQSESSLYPLVQPLAAPEPSSRSGKSGA